MSSTRLDYGQNFSHWPLLKWVRAKGLYQEFLYRFEAWLTSRPAVAIPSFSDDRLSADLSLLVKINPPLEEWALIIGDVIHNLASSLDSLAWTLCTLNNAQPAKPSRVYFPMDIEKKTWSDRAKMLESMPPDVIERLHAIQPWTLPTPHRSLLALLRAMDNEDKHRQLLSIEAGPRAVLMPRREDGFYKGSRIVESETPPSFETGYRLGKFISANKIPREVEFESFEITPRLIIQVGGERWELTGFTQVAIDLVKAVHEWVLRGERRPPLMMVTSSIQEEGKMPARFTHATYVDAEDERNASEGK